jgi:proteasome lid subunit RPN8/RPN11
MALRIDKRHLELIEAYGEGAYPNECCGFLLGKEKNGEKEVLSTLPAFNAQDEEEQHHRFLITSADFLRVQRFATERGMEIVGFYHSHPDEQARPSRFDLEHGWPWYSYIIVSVSQRKAADLTSWVLEDDRSKFRREQIVLERPEEIGRNENLVHA